MHLLEEYQKLNDTIMMIVAINVHSRLCTSMWNNCFPMTKNIEKMSCSYVMIYL